MTQNQISMDLGNSLDRLAIEIKKVAVNLKINANKNDQHTKRNKAVESCNRAFVKHSSELNLINKYHLGELKRKKST